MKRYIFFTLSVCTLLSANQETQPAPTEAQTAIEIPAVEATIAQEPLIVAATPKQATTSKEEEPAEKEPPEIQEQNKNFQSAIFKTFASLAALISLVLFTVWLLKRISQNRHTFGLKSHSMQILEKRLLSPKTTLFLMEVDGKKIVFAESMLEVKVLYTETSNPISTTPVPYQ